MRTYLAFAAVGLAAFLAACGGDDPATGTDASRPAAPQSRTIVAVGDQKVTKRDFDHWMAAFAKAQPPLGSRAATPDPPRFERCVDALDQAASQRETGSSEAQLRKRCRQAHQRLRRQTMQFLIQAAWVTQEAQERDIEVDPKQLRESFDRDIADSFDDREALNRHLERLGFTREDVLFRLRFAQLQARLMNAIKAEIEVSDEDVERFYRRNREQFDGPLETVEQTARRVLRQRREQKVLQAFTGNVADEYRKRTRCAPDYTVPECGGAPLPSSDAR